MENGFEVENCIEMFVECVFENLKGYYSVDEKMF